MIIVSGTTTLEAGQRDPVLASAIVFANRSRAEPGCRAFVLAADVNDIRVIHHYEEWEDDASLEAHLASDHVQAFRERIADLRAEDDQARRYEVVEAGPLYRD